MGAREALGVHRLAALLERRINRGDLTSFFGISIPQASLDLARYIELAPDNAKYDRSGKVYVASETFQALYPGTTPERYLNELLARGAGVMQQSWGSPAGRRPWICRPTRREVWIRGRY